MNVAGWGSLALGIVNTYLIRMIVRFRSFGLNLKKLSSIWAMPVPAWKIPEEEQPLSE